MLSNFKSTRSPHNPPELVVVVVVVVRRMLTDLNTQLSSSAQHSAI
ncbi:hypothetical protein [Fischerella thermalis]|nr:hypothetical protein [Fischerella thermalis]MBF1988424.1 hypothetical protein [Fischerella thermalis M58_A2018_009]